MPDSETSREAFRVDFVTGSTPDKWARIWRERTRRPLVLTPVEEDEQEVGVRSGDADMALARLPVDREGLHCIRLYEERPVVVTSRDHWVSLAESITLEELTDEQLVQPERGGWVPRVGQLPFPAMSVKEAIEATAAGSGIVIVPMSVARLHHRKDVRAVPVADLPPTEVGLVWRVEHDTEDVQRFIGIVRGRTARSSRS